MKWLLSNRADKLALPLADRHYNRQKPGTPQFVPPGRCVVLRMYGAVWVTSWPFAEYVKHEWAGAWVNSIFRNEGAGLSSELILQAIAATRWFWDPPALGIITFVDTDKIRSTNPGYCYLMAGFHRLEKTTRDGKRVLQMLPHEMPEPEPPIMAQLRLFQFQAQ